MRATDLFLQRRRGRRIDCSEAIVRVWGPTFGVGDQLVEEARAWGRGNAPSGHCGALHAAEKLLEEGGRHESVCELRERFSAEAGALPCRDVRKARLLKCRACVKLVEEVLEEMSAQSRETGSTSDSI